MSRYAGRFPMNRARADHMIGSRQNMAIPRVGNTRMERRKDGSLEITYHGNTIMTFHADGTRTYTTDGWGTASTHERLNAMTPPGVHFGMVDGTPSLVFRRTHFTFRYDSSVYELFVDTDGEASARKIGDDR